MSADGSNDPDADAPGPDAEGPSADGPADLAAYLRAEVAATDFRIVVATMLAVYALFAVFTLLAGGGLNTLGSTWVRLTFLFAAYAILSLALNLHWGYTGLFNIGVAGFMGVGVYTMAVLSTPPDAISGMGLGLPLPVGIVGGMLAAALVGLVAAVPALRLRADYLAIVTLGLSEIIRLTLNSATLSGWTIATFGFGTGGGSGIDLPARPTDALLDTVVGTALVDVLDPTITASVLRRSLWVLVMIGFVIGIYVLLARVGNSPFGRVLKAIREDELVAQSLGKDTRWFKIKVFMLGCALMGLGGILWQGSQGYVSPDSFRPIVTFYVFVAVIIGGSGSNTGSLVGSILFVGLLFEGPRTFGNIVSNAVSLPSAPGTFAGAVAPLASLDVTPLLSYLVGNISAFRFILLGVVLILIIQKRPDGVLGHRTETAAAIDLDRPAANGGGNDE
ncbi:branched-chain amino acid ABC transporter permease [Halorubrum sp. JWXQ-INN 858]|uniref:branched-chain amino acid ABC transporter permease n=1 Tax=Halorubrum sp. JWXQ-INN 858 TaxID=2690782 RepID=UPI0013594D62|nr:branched-chain amino acid ABC transporter permease [Halorubrum sp. JWXQ-INN 858]MWV63936.1 branched-chain amino acid ABC transporter permease [Halorubrum sp. JWXQ-INN 858]